MISARTTAIATADISAENPLEGRPHGSFAQWSLAAEKGRNVGWALLSREHLTRPRCVPLDVEGPLGPPTDQLTHSWPTAAAARQQAYQIMQLSHSFHC